MTNRSAVAQLIQDYNTSNQVMIYSKSYCPFCQATKALFKKRFPSAQVKVVELDQEGKDGVVLQQTLMAQTGQRTVPNVFVHNQHVGGNDDVQQAYLQGALQKMLSQP